MKKLNEANMNISVNGDSAAEVSELLRIMQLAGADAKEVDVDDISQKMLPSPDSDSGSCDVCGGDHGPENLMACAGSNSSEPSMGDTIRMISAGEQAYEEVDDGGFGSATTEPEELPGDVSDMIPAGDDLHKEKGSYPATAGGDNPMNTKESIHAMLAKRLAEKQSGKLAERNVSPQSKIASLEAAAYKIKRLRLARDFGRLLQQYGLNPVQIMGFDPELPSSRVKNQQFQVDQLTKALARAKAELGGGMAPLESIKEKKKPDADGDGVPPWADKDDNDPEVGADDKDEEVAERDIESNFENKHKDINNLGRKMMDMSTQMSGTDDTSLMMGNALSRLGEVLAEFGGNGFAANNMKDVVEKSALSKEIVQMLMKKAKAAE
jgi:hypothetical protein